MNLLFSETQNAEAATKGVLYKKVFLEISQNSWENTCARASFLIKLQASGKEPLQRTPFIQNTSGRLLLKTDIQDPWKFMTDIIIIIYDTENGNFVFDIWKNWLETCL